MLLYSLTTLFASFHRNGFNWPSHCKHPSSTPYVPWRPSIFVYVKWQTCPNWPCHVLRERERSLFMHILHGWLSMDWPCDKWYGAIHNLYICCHLVGQIERCHQWGTTPSSIPLQIHQRHLQGQLAEFFEDPSCKHSHALIEVFIVLHVLCMYPSTIFFVLCKEV